jgi:hypothetical protein
MPYALRPININDIDKLPQCAKFLEIQYGGMDPFATFRHLIFLLLSVFSLIFSVTLGLENDDLPLYYC